MGKRSLHVSIGGSSRRQVMKRKRRLMEGSPSKAVTAALTERVGYSKKTKHRDEQQLCRDLLAACWHLDYHAAKEKGHFCVVSP